MIFSFFPVTLGRLLRCMLGHCQFCGLATAQYNPPSRKLRVHQILCSVVGESHIIINLPSVTYSIWPRPQPQQLYLLDVGRRALPTPPSVLADVFRPRSMGKVQSISFVNALPDDTISWQLSSICARHRLTDDAPQVGHVTLYAGLPFQHAPEQTGTKSSRSTVQYWDASAVPWPHSSARQVALVRFSEVQVQLPCENSVLTLTAHVICRNGAAVFIPKRCYISPSQMTALVQLH